MQRLQSERREGLERTGHSPSPRSRGEGWGEGDSRHIKTRGESPSPGLHEMQSDLSPQAGRGRSNARADFDSRQLALPVAAKLKQRVEERHQQSKRMFAHSRTQLGNRRGEIADATDVAGLEHDRAKETVAAIGLQERPR